MAEKTEVMMTDSPAAAGFLGTTTDPIVHLDLYIALALTGLREAA